MDQNQDEQYLKLLSIFHYVVGAVAGLFACFPIIHLVAGIFIVVGGLTHSTQDGISVIFGLIFVAVAGSMILFGWAFAVCIILAGRFIAKRRNYMFCLVMAGIECTFMPFGTVLGVFTIITLVRSSVRERFEAQASLPQAS
jgi:hypothetical protein